MTASLRTGVPLTAHPLQRVGAYALAALARVAEPGQVTSDAFDNAMRRIADHAVSAAAVRDTKSPEGFWLKCGMSFFPNAPTNHNTIYKKTDAALAADIGRWFQKPATTVADCVLCGDRAVAFFGKMDVPLAEGAGYRNTTPRGHEGMALCWPCACSFRALPYGCHLTGGPSVVVHSWDDRFLARTVAAQVDRNWRAILVNRRAPRQWPREVVALRALRHYDTELGAGLELLVFSNNNREQRLDSYKIDQPLAEWLRRTVRDPARRSGFRALLRAHQTPKTAGLVGLARNAFRAPERVVRTCGGFLTARLSAGVVASDSAALTDLCFSYVIEVIGMDQKDLHEIRTSAGRVATIIAETEAAGPLKEFYSVFKQHTRLRSWLQRRAVDWALKRRDNDDAPLLTDRAYGLLFDPSANSQAWFHRDMFLIAVLEALQKMDWRPLDAEAVAKELAEQEDLHPDDRNYSDGVRDDDEEDR